MVELIGYIAATLTTACYFPQAFHILRTRETKAISLLAYATLFTGITGWIIYGFCIHSWPLIWANGITLPVVGLILAMKLRHG